MADIEKDKNGNPYIIIQNIRVSLIKKETRNNETDWTTGTTIRFQSYKNNENSSLNPGAEINLENNTILKIIEALCILNEQNGKI